MEFNLPVWAENGGDGSVVIRPEATLSKAKANCEAQSEGWGENSARNLKLRVEDGILFVKQYGADWVEVTQS